MSEVYKFLWLYSQWEQNQIFETLLFPSMHSNTRSIGTLGSHLFVTQIMKTQVGAKKPIILIFSHDQA